MLLLPEKRVEPSAQYGQVQLLDILQRIQLRRNHFWISLAHRSNQLAFPNKYIESYPEIYGNKFDVYDEIQADVGNVSDVEIMRRLDETKLIRKNFVRNSVFFDSYSRIDIRENPSITVDHLVSSIGGTPESLDEHHDNTRN